MGAVSPSLAVDPGLLGLQAAWAAEKPLLQALTGSSTQEVPLHLLQQLRFPKLTRDALPGCQAWVAVVVLEPADPQALVDAPLMCPCSCWPVSSMTDRPGRG